MEILSGPSKCAAFFSTFSVSIFFLTIHITSCSNSISNYISNYKRSLHSVYFISQ